MSEWRFVAAVPAPPWIIANSRRPRKRTGESTIFWPDTGSRVIFFEDGVPIDCDESEADGDAKMTLKKETDLFTIHIGEQRLEIPDAVMLGV